MKNVLIRIVVASLFLVISCTDSSDSGEGDESSSLNSNEQAGGFGTFGAGGGVGAGVPGEGGGTGTGNTPGPDAVSEGAEGGDSAGDVVEAGDAGESDSADAGEESFAGYASFPSAEVGVSILSPSPFASASLQKGSVSLSGIAFGPVKSMKVTCSCGDEFDVTPAAFWGTPPVTLSPGDNVVTVTATGEDGEEMTDVVTISYTPFFEFESQLEARPSTLWVNEPTSLFFSISMPKEAADLIDPSSVALVQVDQVGNTLAEWPMKDDGAFAVSGDEVFGDGVYSSRMTVTHSTVQELRFRVRVLVNPGSGEAPYQAYSSFAGVDALARLSAASCQLVSGSLQQAQALFDDAAEALTLDAAEDTAFEALQGDPNVAQVGRLSNGYGAWALFNSGMLGVVHGGEPGTRGGGSSLETTAHAAGNELPLMSRDAYVLSPFATEIGGDDESVPIAKMIEDIVCPSFSTRTASDGTATIEQFQDLNKAGLAAVVTHGVVGFKDLEPSVKAYFDWEHEGSQAMLLTGEALNCQALEAAPTPCSSVDSSACGPGSTCIYTEVDGTTSSGVCLDQTQVDLLMGRIAVSGTSRLAILPSFIRNQAKVREFSNSLVYLGACDSMWNGSLATAFYLSGARGITGFTGTVSSTFALKKGMELFSGLLEDKQLLGAAVITEQDPDHADTWFRLVGATNLDVNQSDIINADFEVAPKKITGWELFGDARAETQLGSSLSVKGKYMAILSTGMGYTQEIGEISQTFCIPEDVTTISFWWKLFSAEFMKYCGSDYMDAFEATLVGQTSSGQQELTLVTTDIDKLCPPDQCTANPECGTMHDEPLDQSDLVFESADNDGVWNTQWREVKVDVSSFAGQGPVTLRFYTSDKADSIFDTAVLVDDIQFE